MSVSVVRRRIPTGNTAIFRKRIIKPTYLPPAYVSTVFSSQDMTVNCDTFVFYN